MFYVPKKPPMTYKKWRETYNPWRDASGTNTYFHGNLNPTTDANLIEAIHSLIDEYFNPRYIGVYSPDRFNILFYKRLNEVEYNFYQALTSDRVYSEYQTMLKEITMTATDSRQRSEEHQNNDTRTDDLSYNVDRTQDPFNTSVEHTYNNVKDTSTNTGNDTMTATNEATNASTGFNRTLQSDTPQSNVLPETTGIDTPISWKYASDLSDGYNKDNSTSNTTSNSTNETTLNGSNTRTGSESTETNTSIQSNTETGSNTGTVKNVGTSTITGNDSGNNSNDGRNTNIANLLVEWKEYVYKQLNAFRWLIDQLETCFISVYDEENEED